MRCCERRRLSRLQSVRLVATVAELGSSGSSLKPTMQSRMIIVETERLILRHFHLFDGDALDKNKNMKKSDTSQSQSASELISNRIAELGDWRGETLGRMRKLINEAAPDVVEEWKWVKPKSPGTPVWSHDGIICTGESYKNVVKLTFARGASLNDPARLFNSSLDGNVRRAIDIHEGEEVDESAFKALVRQAVALNSSGKSKPSKKEKS